MQRKYISTFKVRCNDSKKADLKPDLPLARTQGLYLFERLQGFDKFGGRSSDGPHAIRKLTKHINSKEDVEEKVFYLAPHKPLAYFAYEVLNLSGWNTPPAKLVGKTGINLWDNVCTGVALRQIIDYVPIGAFIHQRSYEANDHFIKNETKLQNINKNFKLNIERQTIVALATGEEYKISGNLFTADIAAHLVQDSDFQPEEYNVGLKRIGNRFFAFLIDKDEVAFAGLSYSELQKVTDERVMKSLIFSSATKEQKLFIIKKLQRMLDDGDISAIFLNSRVVATKKLYHLAIDLNKLSENFIKTAKSTIEYFLFQLQESLSDFDKRENIRLQLAKKIVTALNDTRFEIDKEAFIPIILEDLRGPYYQYLFTNKNYVINDDLNNQLLYAKVLEDQLKEVAVLNQGESFNAGKVEEKANDKKRTRRDENELIPSKKSKTVEHATSVEEEFSNTMPESRPSCNLL